MIRVLNVITGLGQGGAETVLARLVARLDRTRFDARVVSLAPEGPLAGAIRAARVPLTCLDMRGAAQLPGAIQRLRREIAQWRPDVVQTWLYHADLVGTLACWGLPVRLMWNLRCSDMDMARYSPASRAVRFACAHLSRRPDMVLANSKAGLKAHLALGYRPRRNALVPNGYDLDAFQPDPQVRAALRAEWGVPEGQALIGMVARWDPQKDHETFIRAAALLASRRRDVGFVLAGDGLEPGATGIADLLARVPVAAPIHLLGRRADPQRVMATLDVGTLSSAFGEGMPNAVAECMACAVPCAVTDVGDCADLVADTGMPVPPRDPAALAAAWERLLNSDRAALGRAARARIQAGFGLDAMVARYQEIWSA